MARQKQKRFDQLGSLSNVIQWQQHGDNNELNLYLQGFSRAIVELGCGKGEHIVALAEQYPQRPCLGVDIKGERIFVGATHAVENHLHNTRFVRAPVEQLLPLLLPSSVSQIWLTFCDPQLKKPEKCLASKTFFAQYARVLMPNGVVVLKTDSESVAVQFCQSAVLQGDWTVSLETVLAISAQSAFEHKWQGQGISTIVRKATKHQE